MLLGVPVLPPLLGLLLTRVLSLARIRASFKPEWVPSRKAATSGRCYLDKIEVKSDEGDAPKLEEGAPEAMELDAKTTEDQCRIAMMLDAAASSDLIEDTKETKDEGSDVKMEAPVAEASVPVVKDEASDPGVVPNGSVAAVREEPAAVVKAEPIMEDQKPEGHQEAEKAPEMAEQQAAVTSADAEALVVGEKRPREEPETAVAVVKAEAEPQKALATPEYLLKLHKVS